MLTVIIPSRDRADSLQRTLRSLQGQTLPPEQFEVLVIDNDSSDHTAAVVADAHTQLPNIRYFREPRPGLHAGRHRGLKEAAGDILVFADDDIRATPDWLSAIAENFSDPSVVMVGGNNHPDFMTPPPAWLESLWRRPNLGGRAISWLSVLSLPVGRREISPFLIWGCNFSIRKPLLLDAGGFHPDAMPQELIRFRGDGETHVSRFVANQGLRCVFDSRASIHHAVSAERMTFQYFRRRAYNQGVSDSYTRLRAGQEIMSTNPLSLVRRIATRMYAAVRECGPLATKLRDLERTVQESREEGRVYHWIAYHEDAEVREWVHRPDYY